MNLLADLLIEYSKKIIEINPEIDWGNVHELKDRMKDIAKKIYTTKYDFKNFYFSDFNGKSPQGEMWEYLDSRYPELKEIGDKIKNELNKFVA